MELTLRIENRSVLSSLRKVLSLMEGVTIVKKPKASAKQGQRKLTAYEQSREDVRCGRVAEYKDLNEFYQKMGI